MDSSRTTMTLRQWVLRLYLPAAVCFLVINLTNDHLLAWMLRHHLLYQPTPDAAVDAQRTAAYFLVPCKSLLFFLGSGVLLLPVAQRIWRWLRDTLQWKDALRSLLAIGAVMVLIAPIVPMGFGRAYARVSTDPFSQSPDQLYRRLLLPGLAHLYHLDGVLYALLLWALLWLTVVVMKAFLRRRGVEMSLVEEMSLLTVGAVASAFELPGQPEFFVFLLALVALMAFEEDGSVTLLQGAAFALALMTHESCAVIVFAPMVFLFGRRTLVPFAALIALYVLALGANFSFHFAGPVAMQGTPGEHTAWWFLRQAPWRVPLGALCSFKLLWVTAAVGLYWQMRQRWTLAAFTVSGLALAVAGTCLGIDYSRLVGFAMLPMLLCLLEARRHLPRRMFAALMLLNLIAPSVLFAAGGISPCRGAYSLVWGSVLPEFRR